MIKLKVFFINHGTVNLKSSNGISFHTINNGDIFGEIEVLQKEFRICSAQAHNRCLLFALNRKDFSKMIDDYPQVCDEVIFSSKKINKNYLIRYFYQKLEIYDELQHFLLKKKIRENCVKKKALFEDSKKRANESSNKGYGGLILSGTETNPQQSIQKTIQMKFMLVCF